MNRMRPKGHRGRNAMRLGDAENDKNIFKKKRKNLKTKSKKKYRKEKYLKKKTLVASVTQAWIDPQCGCVKYRRRRFCWCGALVTWASEILRRYPPLASCPQKRGQRVAVRDGWSEIWFGFAWRLGAFGNSLFFLSSFFPSFYPPGVDLWRDWKHPSSTHPHAWMGITCIIFVLVRNICYIRVLPPSRSRGISHRVANL